MGRAEDDHFPGVLEVFLQGGMIVCPCEILLVTEDNEIALRKVQALRGFVFSEGFLQEGGKLPVLPGVTDEDVVEEGPAVEIGRHRLNPFPPRLQVVCCEVCIEFSENGVDAVLISTGFADHDDKKTGF